MGPVCALREMERVIGGSFDMQPGPWQARGVGKLAMWTCKKRGLREAARPSSRPTDRNRGK